MSNYACKESHALNWTRSVTAALQTGHSVIAAAHVPHTARWPHGTKTNDLGADMHTTHVRSSPAL